MDEPVPVFAYGSNLHLGDLTRWMAANGHGRPGIHRATPGILEGHRLAWDLPSPTRGGGAADVRASVGDAVTGAVLFVDGRTFAALDEKEGHPEVYDRRRLPVRALAGEAVDAWVYLVTDAWRRPEPVWPSTHYLGLLHAGSRAHGLPIDHRRALRATPSVVPEANATLRAATEADADAIGRVHVACWREAYRGLLPADYLARLDPLERGANHREAIRTGGERGRETLVVLRDEAVVGFAVGGPRRDRDLPGGVHEVYAIYLLEAAHGAGIGRALFERALWPAAGDAVVWVLEGNDRAIRFYEAAGFRPDRGRRVEAIGGAPAVHLRYRRRSPPAHRPPARPRRLGGAGGESP